MNNLNINQYNKEGNFVKTPNSHQRSRKIIITDGRIEDFSNDNSGSLDIKKNKKSRNSKNENKFGTYSTINAVKNCKTIY